MSEMLIYLRERFPLRIYLPLSGFLALGLMSSLPEHGGGWFFAQAVLLLLVLLFPLRLLDDLSSIEEDRTREPERLLCRTEELRFFWNLLYGLLFSSRCACCCFVWDPGTGSVMPFSLGRSFFGTGSHLESGAGG